VVDASVGSYQPARMRWSFLQPGRSRRVSWATSGSGASSPAAVERRRTARSRAHRLRADNPRAAQGTELAAAVHRGERIARAEQQLLGFVWRSHRRRRAGGRVAGRLPSPVSWPATACTPSRPPVPWPRRPRSAVSSLSRWPGCVPRTGRTPSGTGGAVPADQALIPIHQARFAGACPPWASACGPSAGARRS